MYYAYTKYDILFDVNSVTVKYCIGNLRNEVN